MWIISIFLFLLFMFLLVWIASDRFKNMIRRIAHLGTTPHNPVEAYQKDVLKAKLFYEQEGLDVPIGDVQQLIKNVQELKAARLKAKHEVAKAFIEYIRFGLKTAVVVTVIIAAIRSGNFREYLFSLFEKIFSGLFES